MPLSLDHHDALVSAVRDGELWRLWYTSIPDPAGMAAEIERRLALQAARSMLPFTVLEQPGLEQPGGRVVGMTTYMNIDAVHRRVEVGSTWYARGVHPPGTRAAYKGRRSTPRPSCCCSRTPSTIWVALRWSFARTS